MHPVCRQHRTYRHPVTRLLGRACVVWLLLHLAAAQAASQTPPEPPTVPLERAVLKTTRYEATLVQRLVAAPRARAMAVIARLGTDGEKGEKAARLHWSVARILQGAPGRPSRRAGRRNAHLRAILERHPESTYANGAASELARHHLDSGDAAAAMKVFTNRIASSPRSPGRYNSAAWFMFKNDLNLDLALQFCARGLALDPKHAAMLDTQAEILFKKARTDEAIEAIKRAQKADPSDSHYDYQLARFTGGCVREGEVLTREACDSLGTKVKDALADPWRHVDEPVTIGVGAAALLGAAPLVPWGVAEDVDYGEAFALNLAALIAMSGPLLSLHMVRYGFAIIDDFHAGVAKHPILSLVFFPLTIGLGILAYAAGVSAIGYGTVIAVASPLAMGYGMAGTDSAIGRDLNNFHTTALGTAGLSAVGMAGGIALSYGLDYDLDDTELWAIMTGSGFVAGLTGFLLVRDPDTATRGTMMISTPLIRFP